MKTMITRIKRLALALCFATPLVSWADAITAVNPVTGETETYTYKFIGTDTWNGTEYWQDSNGDNPSAVPAKSGDNTWDPILFDGNTININASMSVEGWNLRMGLYNGANVTMNNFVKYQGDTTMWMTVDETSQLTIGGFGGGNITDGQAIKLSVAKANGITWNVSLTSGNANNTFEYYLKGAGSVSYQAVSAANHKIKQADVALSGNEKSVQSKTLVSFTSTDKTFTADAAIKIKSGENVLKTVYLTSVTADATTLTTAADVGTCELVQTSTGIDLYWVDGDPANLPAATVYKPSININFTDGTALSTGADVGIGDYAVPGTSWNNLIGNNGSLATVTGVDDAGVTSTINGAKVTISGTRGYYYNGNVQAASDLRQGYIDDNANNPSPQFVVEGIPYYSYKTILYFSSDNNETKFGYVTVNGANYKGDLDNTATVTSEGGSDIWGSASVSAFTEGGNYLVIPTQINTDGKLTVVSHRLTGSRAGLAAVQIIEVKPDVGENDLEIAVDGEKEYTVTAEDAEKTGTVYLTGSGTLTLAGENKISASTIDVGLNVTLNINADRLDATTFTGGGTVVYNGALPPTDKGWTDSDWTGTVWIKNLTQANFDFSGYGSSASTVRLTGVAGHFAKTKMNIAPAIELVDDGDTPALNLTNGYSYNSNGGYSYVKINTLKGAGTLKANATGGALILVAESSEFTGALDMAGKAVYFGDNPPEEGAAIVSGSVVVTEGATATIGSATAAGGFTVDGTLTVKGTLSSSAATAVKGAGTVVFGGVPSPTGDTWWKNSAWTGTVQVKDVTNMVGDNRAGVWLQFNDYGNSGSVVELKNVTGWLPTGYSCTVPLKISGTLYLNNGGSGKASAFKVGKLLGDGCIYGDGSAPTVVFNVTTDWSGFTGTVALNNKCVVFGETIPDNLTEGTVYVSSGAVVTPQQASGTWWAVGGIKVDGELRAPNLDKFGGGTTITTSDTGVFTLTDSNNTWDHQVDYARITGTGTLRYANVSGKWRSLSQTNFPTGMICENNLSEGLILQSSGGEHVIGSLAGSGSMRSDWGGTKNVGDRSLKILQAKNTTYSGVFHSDDRITTVTVAPGTTTAGTLTLTNTQTVSNDLAIESGAAVNLTGTWKGATTVAGTFGGTGTLTGDLTFSDGATFKANASALTVSGTVTLGESLTIDATGLTADEVTVLSSESITAETDVSKVTVNGLYTVTPVAGALKLVSAKVAVTVPAILNTTVTVKVGEDTIGTEAGSYKVAPDSVVTVTYAAAAGYEISGTTEYTIDTSKSETTFDPTGKTTVKQYVAKIDGGASYTSLQAAIDATAQTNSKIVLLANEEDGATVPSVNGKSFFIYAGEFTHGTIADAVGDFVTTVTDAEITIDEVEVSAKKYRVVAAVAVVTIPNEGATKYGDYMMAYNAFLAGPVGTTMRVIGENPFSTEIPCTTYDSETQTYTKLAAVASITVGQITTNYPSLADAIEAAEAGQTVKLLQAVVEKLVLTKAVTIDVGQTVSFGAGIDIQVDGGYVIGDEMSFLGDTTWIVETISDVTPNRRVKYGYGARRTVKMDYQSGDGNVVVTTGDLVRRVPDDEAADMGGPLGVYFYVKDGADLSFTVTPYGDRLVSSATIKVGEAEAVDLPAPVGDVYTVAVTGDSVVNVTFAMAQAQIGTTLYPTLAEAVTAAENGQTVKLLSNISVTSMQVVDKTMTLDLNGFAITEGTWTDAAITAKDDAILCVVHGGSLTVNDSSVGKTGAITAGGVKATSAIKMTKLGDTDDTNKAILVVNAGTLTGYYYAVSGNGSTGRGNTEVTINGGTLRGTCVDDSVAIFNPQAGTLTIAGGYLEGAMGVYVKSGTATVTVTAGTIKGVGTKTAYKASKNGFYNTGDAFVVDNVGYPGGAPAPSILGGTLVSVNASAIASYSAYGNARITKFAAASLKTSGITEAVASSADVFDDYVDEVPVTPGAQTDPVDTEADAEAEAAKVVPSVPAAVAEALSDDQETAYKALFEAKVVEVTVGETTKYAVEVALTTAAETELQTAVDAEAEDLADAAVAAAADATNGGEATVTTKPGLYYVVEAGTELDGIEPASCTLATSESTKLKVPNKGTKGFYKIRVSVTPVQVPNND